MNGHILPRTPIAVDFWKIRQCPQIKVFFLSHCHADHTAGLSSTWQRPIYCSEVTAKILQHKFHIQDKYIRPLEFNRGYLIPLDDQGSQTMTVTLIDANHCPGATMFLFEGYFGTVLYTADFRFHKDMFVETPLNLKRDINVLYLDNTYCNPSCVFPTREKCEEDIIDIIRCNEDADVVIGIRNLGKEDLLVKISQTFGEWVGVSANMYENAEILDLPNVLSTDLSICRIRTEPLHSISNKRIECWNQRRRTVVILPTALYHGLEGSPFVNQKHVHVVPYSDHSSYSELHKFVLKIKPNSIIPIVGATTRGPFGTSLESRADMSCFKHYLTSSPVPRFEIPETVRQFMSHQITDTCCLTKKQNHKIQLPRRSNSSKSRGCAAMGVVFEDSPEKSEDKPSAPFDHVHSDRASKNSVCDDGPDSLIVIDEVNNGAVKPPLSGTEGDESVGEDLNSIPSNNGMSAKLVKSESCKGHPVENSGMCAILRNFTHGPESGCFQKDPDGHSVDPEARVEETKSISLEPVITAHEETDSDFLYPITDDGGTESCFVDPIRTDDGGTESDLVDPITDDGGTESDFVDPMITVDGGTESDSLVHMRTNSDCVAPMMTIGGEKESCCVDSVITVDGRSESDFVDPITDDGGTASDFVDPVITVDGGTESDSVDPITDDGGTASDFVDPVIVNIGSGSGFVNPVITPDGGTDSDFVDPMMTVDGRTQSVVEKYKRMNSILSKQPTEKRVETNKCSGVKQISSVCNDQSMCSAEDPTISPQDEVCLVQVKIGDSSDFGKKEHDCSSWGIEDRFDRTENSPNEGEEQKESRNKSSCSRFANGSAGGICSAEGVGKSITLTCCKGPVEEQMAKRKRDNSTERYFRKRQKLDKMSHERKQDVRLAGSNKPETEESEFREIVEIRNTSGSRDMGESGNEKGNSGKETVVQNSSTERSCLYQMSSLSNVNLKTTGCRTFTDASPKFSVIPISQHSGQKQRRKIFMKMLTKLLE